MHKQKEIHLNKTYPSNLFTMSPRQSSIRELLGSPHCYNTHALRRQYKFDMLLNKIRVKYVSPEYSIDICNFKLYRLRHTICIRITNHIIPSHLHMLTRFVHTIEISPVTCGFHRVLRRFTDALIGLVSKLTHNSV